MENFEKSFEPKIPEIEIGEGYEEFFPEEFKNNPVKYFEDNGINIKAGDVKYDEEGLIRKDPTAVKTLPAWTNKEGEKIFIVGKKVNVVKSQVGKTADPFYEYKIMEIAKEFNLPVPNPIAKVKQADNHLILMEKVEGITWTERGKIEIQDRGFSTEDIESILIEAQEMMLALQTAFEEIGLVRTWQLKDMIFDIDFQNKKLLKIIPTDWERTEIDFEKLQQARGNK